MSTSGRGAVVRTAGTPFEVVELEFDDPGTGEVLVRLVASGLCHTDLGAQAIGVPFELPGILGHEGAGVVERVGPGVESVRPGDRVLMSFTSCGECASCAADHPAYCTTWFPRNVLGGLRREDSAATRLDGDPVHTHFLGQSSLAEFAIADERSLVKVDESADLTVLAPLGCGVITGVGAMWNALRPGPEDIVAVYGAGAVGLSAVWGAARLGPAILIAIDRVPARLELAKEFGATHVIDASSEDVSARIAGISGGRGTTIGFDSTASPAVGSAAMDSTAPGGTLLIVGVAPPGTMLPVEMTGLLLGKSLRGITLGDANPPVLIPELVALHAAGELPLERLQRRYSLDETEQAAQDMHHGVTVKPVIVF
ncbi:MAG TPA: NAD(P)-dependent alcohol dehydrogenase [Microbacteriaceae bacterium]|nr:NAD(P)-dependent alcohol dehydrogenase [Microbacteriaceae bacterium]